MEEIITELQDRIEELESQVDKIDELEEFMDKFKSVFEPEEKDWSVPVIRIPRSLREITNLKHVWIEEGKQEREQQYQKEMYKARLEVDDQIERLLRWGLTESEIHVPVSPAWVEEFIQKLKKEGFSIIKNDNCNVYIRMP